LKGYNIYVKRKEQDLRELFEKLQEKSNNTTIKDEKIIKLEKTIIGINSERVELEHQKQKLTENVRSLKAQAAIDIQEREFLNNQLMDNKRQNRLLKLAIAKLQEELEHRPALKKKNKDEEEEEQREQSTFITEQKQINSLKKQFTKREKFLVAVQKELPKGVDLLDLEASHIEGTTA